MKMAVRFIMVACVCHAAVFTLPLADPGRLLRVPRIYNALITSDAKLQPSRAFPYSSPVYQPFGLGHPEPVFDHWQPPAYALEPVENTQVEAEGTMMDTSTPTPTETKEKADPKPKTENAKTTPPLTFYPRSFGYYQPQPILPYGYPLGPQPYVFGSPFDFGHTLFKYPTLSFDGYYGGLYSPGLEQIGSAYQPENIEVPVPVQKVNMKAEETTTEKASPKTKSDEVGVRETEFLTDEEENEETADPKDSDMPESS